jgi:hypothetical protein
MFILCFCGMMIGLSFDLQSVLPETITLICTGHHSFGSSVLLHSALLPASNALMFLGGLAVLGFEGLPQAGRSAMAARLGPTFACDVVMLGGMFAAEWLGPAAAGAHGLGWSLAAKVLAMALGMALGMAAWEAATRAVPVLERLRFARAGG